MGKRKVILEKEDDMYYGKLTGKMKYYARFSGVNHDIKGCPLGRSTQSKAAALEDLIYRTNMESKLSIRQCDLEIDDKC